MFSSFILDYGSISRTVYDVDISSLPHADLTGSITPVWCVVCEKKGERKPANGYCAVCTQCYCTKHQEVGYNYSVLIC